jgi:CHAT domain-containing protein/tetratricopeptide (TPR) repeat protein
MSSKPILRRGLVLLACLFSLATGAAEPTLEQLQARLREAEASQGAESAAVVAALQALAYRQDALGQYAASEASRQRALAIAEKLRGPDHPDVASVLNDLGMLNLTLGRYARAEAQFERALAIYEKTYGPQHRLVSDALGNLGATYKKQGRFSQAESALRRALAIQEKNYGSEHVQLAPSLNGLGLLLQEMGKYAEAEVCYKRSLGVLESFYGPENSLVAVGLHNLGWLYLGNRRYADAIPLFQRALVLNEKAFGPEHIKVATTLGNLAAAYQGLRQYGQAEAAYTRALAIFEKVLGPDHPDVATTLNNLAWLYEVQGNYAQAETALRRALTIYEQVLGPEHPHVAASLETLATLYLTQKQYAQAEPLYRRALAIREKTLGAEHPLVALALNNLTTLYQRQGRLSEALAMNRRASAIYRQRILAGGSADVVAREASRNRLGFLAGLDLLARNPAGEPAERVVDESFQLLQLAQSTGTAAAVARMAARFASGSDALGSLVKRRQDAADLQARYDDALTRAASRTPAQRNMAAEQQQRDALARLTREVASIDSELAGRFPEYVELTRPEPLSVSQAKALLRPGEVMLVYGVGDEQSWLWVVRPDKAAFVPLAIGRPALAGMVKRLRGQLDVGSGKPLASLELPVLHDLYRQILAPAAPLLADARHIMVVPDGPLQSLPFSLLVASPPKEARTMADYRQVDWLFKHYALSTLPSVGSLRALRQLARGPVAARPFAGFGDPLLGNAPGGARSSPDDLSKLFRASPGVAVADVRLIKMQARLPESADEIRAMAGILRASGEDLWLQDRATESNVKRLDLAQYRILAFATHGVMANQVGDGMEAGLLLTPPTQGSTEDDGYLSAGEIARLKLNADWVLLSACNTAAADGTPGAEGLSGLAKAFFHAGSRSLLVSHWPVMSEATVALTTTMLRAYAANPALGKAEAQRQAMLALMNTPDHPEYAHPLFWAPFVVVGEGGPEAVK